MFSPHFSRLLLPCLLVLGLFCGSGRAAGDGPSSSPSATSMAQRVQACTICHGREGQATSGGYQPRIAGKPAGYLYNQLLNFRDGRRSNAAMSSLIEVLSDAYLREIAEYYASLDLPYPAPQTRDAPVPLLERGRQLVREGDPALGLPSCNACHGASMTGVKPATPGLLGLPRDYICGQLGAWQTGLRRATPPDCMGQIARRLRAADVSALASWLSSQPVPTDAHPVASGGQALPLDCGAAQR